MLKRPRATHTHTHMDTNLLEIHTRDGWKYFELILEKRNNMKIYGENEKGYTWHLYLQTQISVNVKPWNAWYKRMECIHVNNLGQWFKCLVQMFDISNEAQIHILTIT